MLLVARGDDGKTCCYQYGHYLHVLQTTGAFHDDVRYVSVAGAAVEGDEGAAPRTLCKYAHNSYTQVRQITRAFPASETNPCPGVWTGAPGTRRRSGAR